MNLQSALDVQESKSREDENVLPPKQAQNQSRTRESNVMAEMKAPWHDDGTLAKLAGHEKVKFYWVPAPELPWAAFISQQHPQFGETIGLGASPSLLSFSPSPSPHLTSRSSRVVNNQSTPSSRLSSSTKMHSLLAISLAAAAAVVSAQDVSILPPFSSSTCLGGCGIPPADAVSCGSSLCPFLPRY